MNRRFLSLAGISLGAFGFAARNAGAATYEVTKSDEDWKKILSPEAFAVLRQESTERPFTSKLLDEHRKGTFNCAGCDLAAFSSDMKFDSGTGWPSFLMCCQMPLAKRKITRYSPPEPKCIASAVAAIWAMCLMMAQSPPACAIA